MLILVLVFYWNAVVLNLSSTANDCAIADTCTWLTWSLELHFKPCHMMATPSLSMMHWQRSGQLRHSSSLHPRNFTAPVLNAPYQHCTIHQTNHQSPMIQNHLAPSMLLINAITSSYMLNLPFSQLYNSPATYNS